MDSVVRLCVPGGSLTDAIVKREMQGELFSEVELKELLLQVSMGLKYIHSSGLVHLDIKPSMPRWAAHIPYFLYLLSTLKLKERAFPPLHFVGNIFICLRPSRSAAGEGESEEEDDGSTSAGVIYKIGIKCLYSCCLNVCGEM